MHLCYTRIALRILSFPQVLCTLCQDIGSKNGSSASSDMLDLSLRPFNSVRGRCLFTLSLFK